METGRFYNSESMDMNALFQQDIDLGINWQQFEPVKNFKEAGFDSENFIVDGETGECLPNPQRALPQKIVAFDEETGQNPDFNIEECLDFLTTSANVKPVAPITTLDQSYQPVLNNPETINKELWDDIATLSEAYLALDSGDLSNEEMSESINSVDSENGQFQQLSQYQSEVYGSPTSIDLSEPQTTIRKEQYYNVEPTYHGYPTPPYAESSESQTTFSHPTSVTFPPERSEKLFAPADLEEAKLTELLLVQQQNALLAQLDVVNANLGSKTPAAPVINKEPIDAPGGWFFGGTEPENNFGEVLTELDLMNNMQNQSGAYLNPSDSPYIPPPISSMDVSNQGRVTMVSDSECSDSGYSDAGMSQHMDIEMQDTDVMMQDSNGMMTINDKYAALDMDNDTFTINGKKPSQRESRDLKKARELNVMLTMDEIINSPVEEYNELITHTSFNAAQQTLIRDIRRRGKNKVAAQNCRKRKIETISSMEIDIDELNMQRQELVNKQREIEETKRNFQGKYKQLYQQIFSSLRDDSGRPYDQSNYSLQQVEGAVILVPGGHSNKIVEEKKEKNRTVAFFDLSKVKMETSCI